ncbi:MAG: heme biosynthesis HemY N-terminal domain-containing protein [Pseudomonadota bacterium]
MFRIIIFLLIVLATAVLFAWAADYPNQIFIQSEWLAAKLGRPGEEEVGISLTLALAIFVALVAVAIFISGLLRGIFGMPSLISRFFDNRRKERGYRALSQGLIAASSGDVDTARSLAKESGKLLKDEPLVALLGTQTALLEGKRDEARQNFEAMLEDDNTRMVALRGLFLEAERQGEGEAARHYAEEAVREAPALPWAGSAKLRYQAADADWDSAIQTLAANRSAGLVDRDVAKRQRAVLLAAKAMSEEQANPDAARKLAKEAHKLAKDLVPAATAFARSAARLGDIRGATKVLEATWKQMPHPEIAEAYATVRAGDSVQDRLKRARKLAGLKANHPEGSLAVAIAAIDAKDWEAAREALEPVLTTRPTERACLLMADIEEGQYGDQGRMRDWLSRAVRAPADEAWTADGHVSEEWLPLSPVTGEIDAFKWQVPVAQLGDETAPVMTLEELKAEAIPEVDKSDDAEDGEVIDLEAAEKSDSEIHNDEVETSLANSEAAEMEVAEASEVNATDSSSDVETSESANDNEMAESSGDAEGSYEKNPTDTEKNANNQVEFPFGRRPDDPGVHPDKEPPKKGFKLF